MDNFDRIKANTVTLTNINILSVYLKEMTSGWFYKCNNDTMNDIDKSIAYVKIPGSYTIFVHYSELYDIIKNKYNVVFYKDTGEKILNTVSHDNAYPVHFNSRPDHVGASHCQKGSDIQIHELYKARSSGASRSSRSSRAALLDNSKKIVKMNKPKAKSTSVRKSVSSEKLKKRLMAESL